MSKLKGLRTLAEEFDEAQGIRRGDTVVPGTRPSDQPGDMSVIDDMIEYERVQGELDAARQAEIPATPADVRAEIAARELREAEDKRIFEITNAGADYSTRSQTQTPEEFAARLEQLRDPEYSARGTLGVDFEMDDLMEIRARVDRGEPLAGEQFFVKLIDDIEASRNEHLRVQAIAFDALNANPRWTARIDEWYGDSPYRGEMQYHVDRYTDPTRPNSFIQFEDPWEVGFHAGTSRAAFGVIRRSVEDVIFDQRTQHEALEQVADVLGISLKEVQEILVDAGTRHFERRFTKNGDVNIWEDTRELLSEFVDAIGGHPGQVSQFIEGLKGLPTSNSTPFLFRGQNGMLLRDNSTFKPAEVLKQLEEIYNNPDDLDILDSIASAGDDIARTEGIQRFIESKGFDHIIYHNRVEDQGSLSILFWDPDLMISPFDRRLQGLPSNQARAASQYVLGALGLLGGAGAELRADQPD